MPILRFDLIEGRTEAELKTLLDAAHRAVLAAFTVPERDRFQIVDEHKRSQMIIENRGLGIERSDKVVVVQVTSRQQHERGEKVAFYKNLCEELERACGISSSDVVVTISDISNDGFSLELGPSLSRQKEWLGPAQSSRVSFRPFRVAVSRATGKLGPSQTRVPSSG